MKEHHGYHSVENSKKLRIRKYNWLIALPILCMGLLAASLASADTLLYQDIPAEDKPLRLHVLANSDSAPDQQLKLAVRDLILLTLEERQADWEDKAQAMAYVAENIDALTVTVNDFLAAQGAGYRAELRLERADFPDIEYDGVTFAAGEYDALRVLLGQAAGHNWWCVLFPPLCFVDAAGEYSQEAQAVTTGADNSRSVVIRFKLAQLWQDAR